MKKIINNFYDDIYSLPSKLYTINFKFKEGASYTEREILVNYEDSQKEDFHYKDFISMNNSATSIFKNHLYFVPSFEAVEEFDLSINPTIEIGSKDYYDVDEYFLEKYTNNSNEYYLLEKINEVNANLINFELDIDLTKPTDPLFSLNITFIDPELLELNAEALKILKAVFSIEDLKISEKDIKKIFSIENKEIDVPKVEKKYLKEDFQTLKNTTYFNEFLKNNKFLENKEVYLWLTGDPRETIKSSIIVEHIGYDFHWNCYPKEPLVTNFPVVHSYHDLTNSIALVSKAMISNDLNGIAYRKIKNKYSSDLEDLIYPYIEEFTNGNIFHFKFSYSKMKLVLGEGTIETYKISFNNLIGFNKENKVILNINEITDNIKDVKGFVNGLNKLLVEIN